MIQNNVKRKFHVVLYFFVVIYVGTNVGTNVGLNTTQKKVLFHLLENPEATADDMAVAIGVTKRTIERNLKKLQEKGLLVRSGAKKSGSWVVIK